MATRLQQREMSDADFLDALGEMAEAELHRHHKERKEWSYHSILDRERLAVLAAADPIVVDPDVALSYVGNLVVEKGHAEYDRVTSDAFETHEVFRAWKNVWVAEEEPHGAAMLEWGKARALFSPDVVHRAIQGFLRNGLSLHFSGPGYTLAYASLQEAATRLTHKAVKDRLPADEREGRHLLSMIIADESRHERFYANMTRHALHSGDPDVTTKQLLGLRRAALGFEMPGIESDIPDGEQIISAYVATGVFTVRKVVQDVLLPALQSPGTYGWDLESLSGLPDAGMRARDDLLEFAAAAAALDDERKSDRRYLLLLAKARRGLQPA